MCAAFNVVYVLSVSRARQTALLLAPAAAVAAAAAAAFTSRHK